MKGDNTEFTFIVVMGSPLEGYLHYGPFADFDSAEQWGMTNHVYEWYVVELKEPKDNQ